MTSISKLVYFAVSATEEEKNQSPTVSKEAIKAFLKTDVDTGGRTPMLTAVFGIGNNPMLRKKLEALVADDAPPPTRHSVRAAFAGWDNKLTDRRLRRLALVLQYDTAVKKKTFDREIDAHRGTDTHTLGIAEADIKDEYQGADRRVNSDVWSHAWEIGKDLAILKDAGLDSTTAPTFKDLKRMLVVGGGRDHVLAPDDVVTSDKLKLLNKLSIRTEKFDELGKLGQLGQEGKVAMTAALKAINPTRDFMMTAAPYVALAASAVVSGVLIGLTGGMGVVLFGSVAATAVILSLLGFGVGAYWMPRLKEGPPRDMSEYLSKKFSEMRAMLAPKNEPFLGDHSFDPNGVQSKPGPGAAPADTNANAGKDTKDSSTAKANTVKPRPLPPTTAAPGFNIGAGSKRKVASSAPKSDGATMVEDFYNEKLLNKPAAGKVDFKDDGTGTVTIPGSPNDRTFHIRFPSNMGTSEREAKEKDILVLLHLALQHDPAFKTVTFSADAPAHATVRGAKRTTTILGDFEQPNVPNHSDFEGGRYKYTPMIQEILKRLRNEDDDTLTITSVDNAVREADESNKLVITRDNVEAAQEEKRRLLPSTPGGTTDASQPILRPIDRPRRNTQ